MKRDSNYPLLSLVLCLIFADAALLGPAAFRSSGHQVLSAPNVIASRAHQDASGAELSASQEASSSAAAASETSNIQSPVLRAVYPAMLQNVERYGHPNLPLGTPGGRQCATLRRLRTQNKLCESDVALLDDLHFTWHTLEDVYEKQKEHFDDFVERLKEYAANSPDGELSPPKKYPADPELGAWVTALRRLKMVNAVEEEHVRILDQLGFAWVSPRRKCGSQFMIQFRALQERLAQSQTDNKAVFRDPTIPAWIQAQQNAELSETRQHYMVQLLGPDWKSWTP
jgi:Helicase associated domain